MNEGAHGLLRRLTNHQFFVFLGVISLAAISWFYIYNLSTGMQNSNAESMLKDGMIVNWNYKELIVTFAMWFVMMMAMMLPSAMPMILVFSAYNKRKREQENEYVATWIFIAGYLSIWLLFSLFASFTQWTLHNFSLLSAQFKLISPIMSGVILMAAGAYQFTKIKNICLANCQSPLNFVMENWRHGKKGAVAMGIKHGLYCLGCCWVLMLLLFAAGIMNILWIALISTIILIEKVFARNMLFTYLLGASLMILGLFLTIKNL